MTRIGPGWPLDRCACPACAAALDAAAMIDGEDPPEPGDATVCLYCAAPLLYGPNLRLQALSGADLEAMPAGDRRAIQDVQALVFGFIRRRAH